MQRNPYTLVLSGLGVGVAMGFLSAWMFLPQPRADVSIVREGGHAYINPLISCNISEDTPFADFAGLQRQLQKQSDGFIASGEAKRISVYFRDMDQGNWTGIRTSDLFAPASLMKVPLLMAYLKDSQNNPGLLQKSLVLSVPVDQNTDEYFKPLSPLVTGKAYSVQQLLDAMVDASDNNAMYVLANTVNTKTLQTVYEDSNIPPVIDETADTVSPQDYMRFFRILYSATLLEETRSQAALELLGKTEFTGGIVAGVPAGTPVVHKFGERTVTTVDSKTRTPVAVKKELHDCGIVYYHAHPYGICIMTEGTDFPQLEKVIAALSKTAYDQVADGLLAR